LVTLLVLVEQPASRAAANTVAEIRRGMAMVGFK
jgi:hypothetical protein